MNEKLSPSANPEVNTTQPKQKLADVIDIGPHLARRAMNKSPEQKQQSNQSRPAPSSGAKIVQLSSWKEKIGKAIMGEDIHGMLEQESKQEKTSRNDVPVQPPEKSFQEKQFDSFTERMQANKKPSIETVDEKIKAVQKCVYIEELIEECLPRIGIVSSDRGVFSPQDLKDILYKVYSGKVSLDEVPLTFGIRAKVVELMKKNGQTAFGEEQSKAPTEVVKEEPQQEPQAEIVPEAQEHEEDIPTIDEIHDVVKVTPEAQENEEDVPTIDEIYDVVNVASEENKPLEVVPSEKISKATEAWKETREEYRAYRKKARKAKKLFLEKTEAFEEERKNTGVLARLMATPKLDAIKEEMLDAELAYDEILESWRSERGKILESFIEKQRAERGSESPEDEARKVSYVARREAILERHVDNEVQMLESLRFREGDKSESRYRLVRGMKAGFNWYRKVPRAKRLWYGVAIGAAIGGALGASGVVAGGALVAGGAAATRRLVGGFLAGSIIAPVTKKIGDAAVDILGKNALDKQHKNFAEKNLGESRKERLAIKKNVRLGKHVATAGAGAAAFLTGAGVANASHSMLDAVGVGEVQAADIPEANEKNFVTKIPAPESNILNKPPLTDVEQYTVDSFNPDGYKPKGLENIDFKATASEGVDTKGAPKVDAGVFKGPEHSMLEGKTKPPLVNVGSPRADVTDPETYRIDKNAHSYKADVTDPETYRIEKTAPLEVQPEVFKIAGIYEEGSSVEQELEQFLSHNTWIQKEYPDLTEVERGKIAHLLRLELMKDPGMVEKLKIHGGDWDRVWKNERYDITIDRSFIENEIEKIHATKSEIPIETKKEALIAPEIKGGEDIQDILEKNGISQAGPENMTSVNQGGAYYEQLLPSQESYPTAPSGDVPPETVEMKGVYEDGSSVDRELKQFLQENAWVKKEYPNLTEVERGTIASLLRLELMKNPAMAEQFKIHENNWTKVGINDTYEINLDRKLVESQIEKVHSTGKVVVPEIGKQQPIHIEANESKKVFQVEEKAKAKSFDEYAQEKKEKLRIKMLEENKKHHIYRNEKGVLETLEEKKTARVEETPQRVIPIYTPEQEVPAPAPTPVEEVVAPKTLNEDLAQAEKIMEENKVDFAGMNSRGSLDRLLKNYNAFDTTLKVQRPMILSNWGPISYARMQDIFDGKGSISYTIGDERPITMGRQVETLTRNIVGQLEKNLQGKVPNIGEVIAEAKKENWTLGNLVRQLSSTLEEQEKAAAAPVAPTPEIVPDASHEIPRVPITEYQRPALQVVESNGEKIIVAKLVPIEVTDEMKKIVQIKYLGSHNDWTSGSAEDLYNNKDIAEFRYVVDVCKADIAADLSGGQVPIPSINIDWSAYKGMTPAEVLAQLEQQHKILASENTTIPAGKVVEKATF